MTGPDPVRITRGSAASTARRGRPEGPPPEPSVPGQNVGLDNLTRLEGGEKEMSWVVVASMPTEKR
jgi:hypothetical protein